MAEVIGVPQDVWATLVDVVIAFKAAAVIGNQSNKGKRQILVACFTATWTGISSKFLAPPEQTSRDGNDRSWGMNDCHLEIESINCTVFLGAFPNQNISISEKNVVTRVLEFDGSILTLHSTCLPIKVMPIDDVLRRESINHGDHDWMAARRGLYLKRASHFSRSSKVLSVAFQKICRSRLLSPKVLSVAFVKFKSCVGRVS